MTPSRIGKFILAISGILLVFGFIGILLPSGGGERPFRSKAETREFRGWFPRFLPESSSDLHIKYLLHNSEAWGRFSFDASDSQALTELLSPQRTPGVRITSPKSPWWDERALEREKAFCYTLRERDAGTFVIVVDWANRVVYFWRPPT